METFAEWLTDILEPHQIADLARYGADAGWPGLRYTSDCLELFERHEVEIHEALVEDAEALGYDSPEALVASFNRSDMLWSPEGRRTLLVWYMAEREAREITEGR